MKIKEIISPTKQVLNVQPSLVKQQNRVGIDAIQTNVKRARDTYYSAVDEMLSKSGQDVEAAYSDAINAQKAIADARKKAASIAELIGKLANATDKAATLLNKAKQ